MLSSSRFYADTRATWGYEPSFDGALIAWWGSKRGARAVFVGEFSSGKLNIVATFKGDLFHFGWRRYANLLVLTEKDRLWEVDPKRPGTRTDVTPRDFQTWQVIVEPRHAGDSQFLVSYDRSPAVADLYATDADGRDKRLVEQNNGSTESWLLNEAQVPCIRVELTASGMRRYLHRSDADKPWQEMAAVEPDDTLVIWRTDRSGNAFEALSSRQRDKIALVSLDPVTGSETVLVEDGDVDVSDALRFTPAEPADVAVIRHGYPRYIALSERGTIFAGLVLDRGGHADIEISGSSKNGSLLTVAISYDERPYQHYLLNLADKSKTLLSAPAEKLRFFLATTKPVYVTARDGEQIPALLTLPSVASAPVPTIVMAHGGPARHDSWGYNIEKSFLASRGYGILSVNYRGSTGFGKRYQTLGYRQFGRKMQDDIADAGRWLLAQGIAAEGKLAVAGESYGGFMAALAMVGEDRLFSAAIIDYAILDLPYQMQNNPIGWGLFLGQVIRYFGNPDDHGDLTHMQEFSPLHKVEKLGGSFLLTAGMEDPVVGFEQTKAFEKALRKAGLDVTALYFDREGHGYAGWQTKLVRAREIELFLSRKLGGKAKKIDPLALLSKHWIQGRFANGRRNIRARRV
ncbi:S9 family peptidase (plasmid) [Rhizobium leguminosarum]|uniref:alpha/beta hydrolase family protein n=1 Tax=Rhizobium leguminosarum TaxID=384 RepID=UPI00144270B0|nr:alpha/beta fold hydrolase [Rhizobium leguminosarum]MBY5838907.1 S9 family peptidase [Rhizobium leguminosarum]NKM77959.1 prolyl oligopeptidase family serine peptidase [Rhizobium leguminosarum bv. viciae]QSZ12735.1 S9 family peptidase [Rhizobium leguminosarum]